MMLLKLCPPSVLHRHHPTPAWCHRTTGGRAVDETETSASARFTTAVVFKVENIDRRGRVLFNFICAPEKRLGPNVKSSNPEYPETLHSDRVKSMFNTTYLNEVPIKYIDTLNMMYECFT